MQAAALWFLKQYVVDLLARVLKSMAYAFLGAFVLLSGCTVVGGGAYVATSGRVFVTPPSGAQSPLLGNAIVPVPPSPGHVTDLDRYLLALAAGWTDQEAITAVAVSIAENTTGNPAEVSSSDDVGLWQINRVWWVQFGGAEALKSPSANAAAAHWIWANAVSIGGGHLYWLSWSTYRVGAHLQYMARARAAALLAAGPATATYVFPLPGWSGAIQPHWGVATAIGGSDLFAQRGQRVVSMSAGSVQSAGFDRIGGNNVLIKGNDGLLYYYAHFDRTPEVVSRQLVLPGTALGVVGNTGDAEGTPTHLHIGIGYWINLGADALGGTGGGFDAVSLLRQVYQQGR